MIELKDVTKKFGDFTAVDHLNMTIETGEFFGLLGPNGAGKSTLMKILGGIIPVVGAVLATIPQAVLGGSTIIMFGSIMFTGFSMMAKCGFTERNMIIISLSLSVGLGFTQANGLFGIFPQIIQTIFAENCVAIVFILAVILNLVLPKGK